MIIRNSFLYLLFTWGAIFPIGIVSEAAAQTPRHHDHNRCETPDEPSAPWSEAAAMHAAAQFPGMSRSTQTHGLEPAEWGTVVYDSNQSVCWLADANLAGNSEIRARLGLPEVDPVTGDGVNPDGTMNYATALVFVKALNKYDSGRGFLGHSDWQLPTNPADDKTCSSHKVDNFGVQCTGSALGNLYGVGLAKTYPASVVPRFFDVVWPLLNLQPGLYWAADPNNGGQATYSFNTGIPGGNTTQYNFFHVLPVSKNMLGPIPSGTGVLPYVSGLAAGKAVYDTLTGNSWLLNANLPAFDKVGVTNTTTITSTDKNSNGNTVTVPLVDEDGAVLLTSADPMKKCHSVLTGGLTTEWITALNTDVYAGTNTWELPCVDELDKLHKHLGLAAGDRRLEWPFDVGPFQRLQPGFYWACVRAASATDSSGPCDLSQSAPSGLEWSFNFDDGFEGTDLPNKQFYVMVYFPARSR